MVSIGHEPVTGAPSGVQGHREVSGKAPMKLKAFCPLSYKRGAKS